MSCPRLSLAYLAQTLRADDGQSLTRPVVIPADPIRAITCGWPTNRELSHARCAGALVVSAVAVLAVKRVTVA